MSVSFVYNFNFFLQTDFQNEFSNPFESSETGNCCVDELFYDFFDDAVEYMKI